MVTERLQRVLDQLAVLPPDEQDAYADWLEADLGMNEHERQRVAAQLADPRELDLDYLLARADKQSAQGKIVTAAI